MTAQLAVVVSGFPRTSETFAIGELVALARAGMLVRIYATKDGDGATPQPGADALRPLVRVLPPGDVPTQAAAVVADLAGEHVDGLHGYFAHEPTAVAAAAAAALGVGYSFSAHALDARKVRPSQLAARSHDAVGVVACNTDVAHHVRTPGARVRILPHGVDLGRFHPQPRPGTNGPLRILAVGRLVEKKGFPVLVEAVAKLRRPFVLRIVGSGAEQGHLEALIARHGLSESVELVGRRSHGELPDDYAWADVVAVPSIVDRNGDRDGLPNVTLEAMASGRPLVASDVAAIGAAVRHAGAGIVVPPAEPVALADALDVLGSQEDRRRLMGLAGRAHVETHFDVDTCARNLLDHLEVLHARAPEPVEA